MQHSFVVEVEKILKRTDIRTEIINDKKVSSMSEFINAANEKDINDQYGKNMVVTMLSDRSPHKAFLERLGIYYMKNRRGPRTPAMTFSGLKGLLSKLTGEFADKYTNYCTETTTRVEAGDKSMHNVIDTNAASSNILNKMARQAIAEKAASTGPSIAAPDVGFKRKAYENNQIYDWQNDERAFEVQVKQYQKNNDVRTKMLAGAEAKVIAADADVKKKIANADADVKKKKGNAEAYAIRLVADGKKSVLDAEAERIKAETALLHFELAQKRKAAGLDTDAKKSETEEKKEERRLALNAKRRESRAQAKAAKDKPPTPPQGAA